MAEPKTKANKASVIDFLNTIEDESKRRDCFIILDLMKEAARAEPIMWGGSIIGFGLRSVRYADGHESDWPRLAFSPRKQNLTLYLAGGAIHNEELLQKLGKHKTSKGCLYINKLADVDLSVLKDLLKHSVESLKTES